MSATVFAVGTLVTVVDDAGKIVRAGVKVARAGKRPVLSDGTEWQEKRGEWVRYGKVSWHDKTASFRVYHPADPDRKARDGKEKERADWADRARSFRQDAMDSTLKAERAEAMAKDMAATVADLDRRIAEAGGA